MKILIADDNVDGAQTLATILELLGHEVHTVHDGGSAVRDHAWFAPAAMICDIGMPVMDGYAVARHLKDLHAGAKPVLIAWTGYGSPADQQAALAAGFDHHLTKPAVVADLLKLLSTVEQPAA